MNVHSSTRYRAQRAQQHVAVFCKANNTKGVPSNQAALRAVPVISSSWTRDSNRSGLRHFTSIPSMRGNGLRTPTVGGVFDTISIDGEVLESAVKDAGVPTHSTRTSPTDLQSLVPEEVLPPWPILHKLYEDKRVSIPAHQQVALVSAIIDFGKNNAAGSTVVLERTLMEIANRDVRNLTMVGTMLARHSPDGLPLARKMLEIASRCGDMDAEYQYAQVLSKDIPGFKKDVKQALQIMRSLASRKHGLSQYILGLRHISTGSDVSSGIKLLESAATSGITQAYGQLGFIYGKGIVPVVPKNVPKAMKYLQHAHEKGMVEATFLLGTHYASGEGSPDGRPDAKKALELFLQAANKGLSIAQHNVASIYFQGNEEFDIKRDIWDAIEYWKMAAEQGLQISQVNLGKLYLEGLKRQPGDLFRKVNKDLNLARSYLVAAVKRGGPLAEEAQGLLTRVEHEAERDASQGRCRIM
ncbi:uncharacterized protein SPPG_03520 [Spizellomyces punctatus DAOM BR117]|uniref:HCP-like protein n=1 Tax=Spizellomyces punctatus (strain DAOM BR117) TaxID=645134 RepID=A0A0L0HKU6_SPIPD|nr:uncharacterized protein SPPG_03520 [Spizellomyces punctatus DAOM BR117]KND01727.1 hypothetical protein SPPG_03520 [Spizellomyces punctatus DAOM BR117]|eukprot:XP_016609766.1 hypothetical protein SPPG_03520 [Spizellomyces punctatus DAOM BR117]